MTTPYPPHPPPHTTPAPASSLPTARQFLTALFNAISDIPLVGGRNLNLDESSDDEGDDPPPGGGGGEEGEQELNKRRREMLSRRQRRLLLLQDDGAAGVRGVGGITGPGAGNVLKQVPVSHRHLIITLHVLFPGLVLPALDLLDRGLVGRIILQERTTVEKEKVTGARLIKEEDKQEPNLERNTTTVRQDIKTETKTEEDDGSRGDTANGTSGKQKETEKEKPAAAAAFYLVRSAQPTSHHHRRRRQQRYGSVGGEEGYPAENNGNGNNLFPGGQRAYIVRLDAWNCTCAAFAFASFSDPSEGEDTATTTTTEKASREERASSPGAGTGNGAAVHQEKEKENINVNNSSTTAQGMETGTWDENQEMDDKMDIDSPLPRDQEEMSETLPNTAAATETAPTVSGTRDDGEDGQGWSFGGMSLLQSDSGNDGPPPPPLCKHLLACLLAERWKDALGRYVVERQVSKEAMAGIVAEI